MSDLIHFLAFEYGNSINLCNKNLANFDKITNDYFKVTCKNCKKILEKDKEKFDKHSQSGGKK